MNLTIKEISGKRDLKKFIKFQYKLYRGNKYYVPPLLISELDTLLPAKNPAYEFCEAKFWLAYSNNKIVGRIAGIINHKYIETWDKKQARFSWFDCIEDENVAFALFETVEKWAKSKGMNAIYGPYGFTNLDKHGVLVEGFNELATNSSNYNYPYYKDFIEKYGYKKEVDWVERSIKVPDKIPDKIQRLSKLIAEKNKLHFKEINTKSDLKKYANELFDLFNQSYAKLYGMVEFTEKQKEWMTKNYYNVLNKDYMAVVYNEDEKMVAFGISMPSLSKALQKAGGRLFPFGIFYIKSALKRNDTLDLLLIGVHPDYQKKGVNALLFNKITPNIFKNGFKYVETTQNLESNAEVQNQWRLYETRQHKRARSFIKTLS
ncbi:MAG: hypothetical protein GXO79_08815 [Chlorobi bacterium]|nr:hypothetical protein [Chlorobiota bacterium]